MRKIATTMLAGLLLAGTLGLAISVSPAKADDGQFVWIDIKPGSCPNTINLNSKGSTPVAVLSFIGFDASVVDPETVIFAGTEPEKKWALKDVDGDEDKDLILKFPTQDLELDEDDTEATLTGYTYDGVYIFGTGSVKIVVKGK